MIWFCKERGYSLENVREDLEKLRNIIRKEKCNEIRADNEWRRNERDANWND